MMNRVDVELGNWK